MTTKLIILLALGTLVLGLLGCITVRAVRYRRRHPDEGFWPYGKREDERD